VAILRYQADQRAALMAQAIGQQTSMLASQLNEQAEKLEQGLVALDNEAAENLRLPETYCRYGYPQFTESWLCGNPFNNDCLGYWISPADNYQQAFP
jgi:hypothetical protein